MRCVSCRPKIAQAAQHNPGTKTRHYHAREAAATDTHTHSTKGQDKKGRSVRCVLPSRGTKTNEMSCWCCCCSSSKLKTLDRTTRHTGRWDFWDRFPFLCRTHSRKNRGRVLHNECSADNIRTQRSVWMEILAEYGERNRVDGSRGSGDDLHG